MVILGNVLCSVPNPERFLNQVDRLVKPGGKIIFEEHIREAPGTISGLIQDAISMWFKYTEKGCQCNSNPVHLIKTMNKWEVEAWELRVDGNVIFDRVAVGVALKGKMP